ncbi:zinc finger protein 99-like [Sitophilus oryzae]|uniref:Zinc finger protein 99-like n=1 Tax=Sitophilus oryzae TaxID=7048 RepID=A0A6J2XN68_SITOR|nr:zinc finger protein 99-like [Sitophilus oryzae]
MNFEHLSEKYTCESCSYQYTAKILLKEHIVKVHAHDYRFFCQFCGKGFSLECRRREHEKRVHTKTTPKREIPWVCDDCGKVLANQYIYEGHKIICHPSEINCYCVKCGKAFPSLSYLQQHDLANHSDREPFFCSETDCGKIFKTKYNLKMHKLIHDKNRQFVCGHCAKVFIHVASFKRHLKEHKEGKKLYQCEVCLKTVTSNDSLKIHMRIHTGEKPFKCSYCEKAFASKLLLKTHIVVHTKEKRYVCRICDKGFTQRGTLRVHFSKNHPSEVL